MRHKLLYLILNRNMRQMKTVHDAHKIGYRFALLRTVSGNVVGFCVRMKCDICHY